MGILTGIRRKRLVAASRLSTVPCREGTSVHLWFFCYDICHGIYRDRISSREKGPIPSRTLWSDRFLTVVQRGTSNILSVLVSLYYNPGWVWVLASCKPLLNKICSTFSFELVHLRTDKALSSRNGQMLIIYRPHRCNLKGGWMLKK